MSVTADAGATGQAAGPAVDREQIAEFVLAVFRHAERGQFVSLRAFYGDGDKRAAGRPDPVRLDDLAELIDRAAEAARECAAAPRPVVFAPPVATFTGPVRARATDLAQGLVLMVELDHAPAAGLARLESILGPATVVVLSGGRWRSPTGASEGKRHAYWRLARPATDPDGYAKLRRAMRLAAALVGADSSATSIVHPMRWPGSLWCKEDPPRLCRIERAAQEVEIDLNDALARLEKTAAAEGIDVAPEPRVNEAAPPPDGPPLTPRPNGDDRAARWAATALEREAAALAAMAPNTGRNHALNRAAFNLGQIAAGGYLERAACEEALMKACRSSGLYAEDGGAQCRRSFESGWSAGTQTPRRPPERPDDDRGDPLERMARRASGADQKAGHEGGGGDAAPEPEREAPVDDFAGAQTVGGGSAALQPTAANDDRGGFTEDGLALDFTRRHGHELRYVALWGQWLRYTGTRWEREPTLRAFDLARAVCRRAAAKVKKDNPKLVGLLTKASTVASVERLAKADRRHASTVDAWDRGPWLLNTPGGTVDLRTGHLRPHDRADLLTKITAAAPGVGCPMWLAFLERVTNGDRELQGFLQRMTGYALTGDISEHALFFLYGTGGNGKGVFINTLTGVLGDYATVASMETFTASQAERHPTDLAMLRGARLVTAQETEEGRRWAESRIKSMTGGDPITARFMRQDFFTFQPQFKLLIAGNHKPGLRNVNEAIRRRFHLVPFTVKISPKERDLALAAKLKAEWPGILTWMIEGCLEWRRIGLSPPAAVRDATNEYLGAEDAVQAWIEECCVRHPNTVTASAELFASWSQWAGQAGEFVGSRKRFGQWLEDRGFEPTKNTKDQRSFRGIGLKGPIGGGS